MTIGYTNIVRHRIGEVNRTRYNKRYNKESDIDQKSWDRVYREMYTRIERLLSKGQTIIHDTGNFTTYERGLVSKIATNLGIAFATIYVSTPTEIAYERLIANRSTKSRFDISDKEFYDAVHEMEIPGPSEHTIIYNQNDDLDSWMHKYLKFIDN